MADSTEEATPADLLRQSEEMFSGGLARFQENHDICTASGFFPKSVLLEVDAGAMSFRLMGLESISAATVVSSQWIAGVLVFYENISLFSLQEARAQLTLLSGQAKELSKIFKVLAAWSKYLAERIKTATSNVHSEVAIFTAQYSQDLLNAQKALDDSNASLKAAKEDLESKMAESDRWMWALVGTSVGYAIFFPVGAICTLITGSGFGAARKAVSSAQDAKLQAEEDRINSQREFDSAQSNDEKAKKIAKVTAELVLALNGMEAIANACATYWTVQGEAFVKHSDTMKAETGFAIPLLVHGVSKQDIIIWKGIKDDFVEYTTVMTRIMNLYNFETDAKPPPTKEYTVDKLAFSLSVPAEVNLIPIFA